MIVTVASAIKTVVIPRSAASLITRTVFLTVRRVYLVLAPPDTPFDRRELG